MARPKKIRSAWDGDKILMLIGARRVGASIHNAARAAGLVPDTVITWLKLGREYEEMPEVERDPLHEKYYNLYIQMEAAASILDNTIKSRVLKATEHDGNLAFNLMKWRDGQKKRNVEMSILKLQKTALEKKLKEGKLDGEPKLELPGFLATPREEK